MTFLQGCVEQLGHFWDQPLGRRGNHGMCYGRKTKGLDETHLLWVFVIESPEFRRILWNSIEFYEISAKMCQVFRAGRAYLGPTVR